jgi:pyruvate dehydrogenase E2 component (dihydrolipoamide acetyltransferase)
MAQIIDMPKLSDTMTVGTLVKWLKQEGDTVKSGDMLAEIETDKATMELESFFDGTLLRLFVKVGAQVPIGAPLCAVGEKGEKVEAPPAPPVPAKAAKPPAPPAVPAATKPDDRGQKAATPPVAQVVRQAPTPSASVAQPSPVSAAPSGRPRISPLARKLAAEKGIDFSRLQGSGPDGRIVRADILAAEQSGAATPPSRSPSSLAAGPSLLAKGPIQADEVVPVSNMRATIARRLVESKTRLPHFYVEVEIDAEPLLALRAQLNSGLEKDGVKLTVSDFILKASAEALRVVPAVNCSWESDPAGSEQAAIRHHSAAHVAFAVAIDDGLITPVIRDAHLKTIFQISTEARELARLAKARKLKPEQFTGGTFCISNLGMMGVERFTAIINPPNAAILAIGTTVKKPVVRDNRIEIGQRMSLFLSCDHRAVDGATGARYLAALKELLEKPALLLV